MGETFQGLWIAGQNPVQNAGVLLTEGRPGTEAVDVSENPEDHQRP